MHGGRVSHPDTTGLRPVGPSAVPAAGERAGEEVGLAIRGGIERLRGGGGGHEKGERAQAGGEVAMEGHTIYIGRASASFIRLYLFLLAQYASRWPR